MVSVIIPTYNREKILPKTIKSVLEQTFTDFEIIVVDDGSTDNTKKMIASSFSDSRLKYFCLEKNAGVHQARNKGLELATGEFINFLDSDDQLYPQALEKAVDFFSQHNEYGMISASYITDSGERTGFDIDKPREISYGDLLCGRQRGRFKGGFVMLRKSAIGQARFVEQNLDFIFYRHVAKNTKMYYLPEVMGIYNINLSLAESADELNLTQTRTKPNIELSKRRAIALANFLKEFGDDIVKYCPRNFSNYAYGAAVGLLLGKQKKQAIKFAYLSWRYNLARMKFFFFFLLTLLPGSGLILRSLFRLKTRIS